MPEGASPPAVLPRGVAAFLRRLVVFMVVAFGLGTVFTNGVALFLVTEAGRQHMGPIPYPLFWFDFLIGWLYLVAGVGIGLRREWALYLAWGLAVAHSFSASAVWLWFLSGHAVSHGTLVIVLMREGFWVLIGLYLWKAMVPTAAGGATRR